MGSIDDGDPNTTNIYLGNLPTKISEQQLMEVFGKYGPLASVKVMWPRTEEEKARNRLSGFVAFMSRRDGERALKHLTGKEILGSEIKLGWGKAVPIPAYPVYIPPTMLEMTMPPPLSGLPFNAQVEKRDKQKLPPPGTPYPTDPKGKEDFERILANATVKVVMPTDRALLALIHRMVEFVIREGPMFEAMIMNKEISNPQFRFLFENQSPAHVYYRWKLYSLLEGDSTQKWRIEEFRMFKGGSIWRPPKLNPFTQGMPDDLIPEEEREVRVGSLSNAQRTRLERMLRRITPDRHRIAEVMIFSIEHSESIDEICMCVKESLCNVHTSLQKKIARLYVVNDVLHNCTAKGMNAFGYRKAFKAFLPVICYELHCAYVSAGGADKGSDNGTNAESFKQRVMGCFKAWDEWGVYSSEFVIKMQNIILGIQGVTDKDDAPQTSIPDPNQEPTSPPATNDSSDEETARTNLNEHRQKLHKPNARKAQLPPSSAMKLVKSLQSSEPEINEEIDGVPLDDDGNENACFQRNSVPEKPKFIPSKWEELDPEQVKAQAVTTTSKWDLFEDGKSDKKDEEEGKGILVDYGEEEEEDIDGEPMEDEVVPTVGEEDRRKVMRDIELKVLAFQDELEKRGVRGDVDVDLVREYREKLVRRMVTGGSGEPDKRKHRRRSSSDEETRSPRRSRRRRSRSPVSSSSKSRSYVRGRSTSSNDSRSRPRSRSRSPRSGDSDNERKHYRREDSRRRRRNRSRENRKSRHSSSDSDEHRTRNKAKR